MLRRPSKDHPSLLGVFGLQLELRGSLGFPQSSVQAQDGALQLPEVAVWGNLAIYTAGVVSKRRRREKDVFFFLFYSRVCGGWVCF